MSSNRKTNRPFPIIVHKQGGSGPNTGNSGSGGSGNGNNGSGGGSQGGSGRGR